MYTPGPSQEELDLIGIRREDLGELPPTEVWPENWGAVMTFSAMSTQWRQSMNGPTGLDYGVLDRTVQRLGVQVEDEGDFFWQIRTLESTALSLLHKKEK